MKKCIIVILLCFSALTSFADVSLNGGIQHYGLFGFNDQALNANYDFPYLSNTYLNLGMQSTYVAAGLRLELMPKPLQGYETSFAGAGVGNLFVQANYKWLRLTLGDVYAQYGSGFVLRLYEDRALGIDNSLRGAKLELTPFRGINIETIGGKQRVYWNCYDNTSWNLDYTQGAVVGGNMELQIDQWSNTMQENNIGLLLGASYVSRYQPMDTIIASYSPLTMYYLPVWTAAADVRAKLRIQDFSLLVEYARKANDPSVENQISYNDGEALLLSGAWSRKGLSIVAQIKRSENMSFRSDRMARGNAAMINYLPAFTTTHTYALAALYPYATQTLGEWAWQGEVRYTAKKNTPFGGKYGTTLNLNFAHVRGLGEGWFSVSRQPYYTDVHLELHKRCSQNWWINAMYMYQTYNQTVVEGHGDLIRANIFVADVKYKVSDNVSMRAEAQYLFSRQAEGQWVFGLYELALWQKLTFTLSDMFNIGGENYWQAGATYQTAGHRLQVSYVRQRAGYNCTGGVCRYVPAQKGFSLNYTYNF